jgi:DNA repair protein RecN (Recombination protein N)
MLRLLRVRNFALIDELELQFSDGFNLLSGETGAGKSLIVDALGLAAGAKASADMVRSGESRAIVEAVFEYSSDSAVDEELDRLGLDAGNGELVVRREISADERNRVFLNSQPSTVGALRELAASLVDIHGQHEQQTLLDGARQLALIDLFAGASDDAERVRALDGALRAARAELSALDADARQKAERLDFITFQRDEIQKANPKPGEPEQARARLEVLAHAGKLLDAAARGYQLLYESETSAASALAQTLRGLRDAASHDERLKPLVEQCDAARIQVQDLAQSLRDYAANTETDPAEMDRLQSRLAELERLQRKYGADLIAHLNKVSAEIDGLGQVESRREDLDRRIASLARDYDAAARALSAKRRPATKRLESQVERELKSLAMPHARFSVAWRDVSPGGPSGLERAELLIAANPGEEPRPLERVASGGELSRVMLALRTVLTGERGGKTLIFDEVDAGIGGEAAETVGKKLKDLAGGYQVLCVTHLAQIAAYANRQYRIEKRVTNGRAVTRVDVLSGDDRVEELARMMSGTRVTEAARAHIKQLLAKS